MNKKIILSLVFVLCAGLIQAKTVLIDDAKKIALSFVAEKKQNGKFLLFPAFSNNLNFVYQKNEIVNGNASVSFYVFNNGENGFIIVAGDDDITPILGYSDNSAFDANNIPPNVQYWLNSYSKQIKYAIENNIKPVAKVKKQWNKYRAPSENESENAPSISPLITTQWNQSPYYNALCPSNTPAGCVAVAMAQIMKYWNFPQRGKGQTTYESNYGVLSANFQNQTYQWCNMPNRVNMSNLAVATLMYHCGVAVYMNYTPNASGAHSGSAAYALVNNFCYDSSMQFVTRDYHSKDSWTALIADELEEGRPLYYAGHDNTAGHAFVCDGYDGGDYFHFNWGWGGYYDGYFQVDALTPGGQGTGGNDGGFNFGQEIIIGIKPNYNLQFVDIQMSNNLSVSPSDFEKEQPFSVTAEVTNNGSIAFNGVIALALFNKNTKEFVKWLDVSENISMAVSESKTVNFNSDGVSQNGSYYMSLYFTNSLFSSGSQLTPDINTNFVGDNCGLSIKNNLQLTIGTYSFLQLLGKIDVYPARYQWLSYAPVDVDFNLKNIGTRTFKGTIKVVVTDIDDNIKEVIKEENNVLIDINKSVNIFVSKSVLETNQGNHYLKCYSEDENGDVQVLFSQYDIYVKPNPDAKLLKNIAIFPNPVEEFLKINTGIFSGTVNEINLYSLIGQVIFKEKIEKKMTEITIPLDYLNQGIYILNIKTSEGTIKTKILKK